MKHNVIFLTALLWSIANIHIAHAIEETIPDETASPLPPTETLSMSAQPTPPKSDARSDANRFRIDISFSMLNFNTFYNLDAESIDPLYGVSLGPIQAPLGVSIGGSIRNRVSLGCRILLGFTSKDYREDVEGTNLDYKLLPYIEIAFGSRRVKPFITFSAGVGGYKSKFNYDNGYEDETTSVQFVTGGGAGVHIFFGERGSLDLWVFETIGVGNETKTYGRDNVDDTESEIQILTTTTDLLLGVGLWI